jgi:HTH-type transcriptional regulator/antitoxin HigA
MLAKVQTAERVWPMMAPVVFVPHTESEYQLLVALLDTLIDTLGEDENHPLASLMEVVGVLIEKYEDEHVPEVTDIYKMLPRVRLRVWIFRRRKCFIL